MEPEIKWLIKVARFRLQADFAYPHELSIAEKRDIAHRLLNEGPEWSEDDEDEQ